MEEEEDEDVLIEGGVLLTYLNEHGIAVSNFETIQPVKKKQTVIESEDNILHHEQVPFWVQSHLNIIMKSGLLFDDHTHFIESFLPVIVADNTSKWKTYLLTATSWLGALCSSGILLKNIRSPAVEAVTVTCLSFPIAIYSTLLLCDLHDTTISLNTLQDAIQKLEKLFTQLRKCTLMIQEADAVLSKFKLPGIELLQFKKSVRHYLKEVINYLSDLTAKLTESFPLDGRVDATAYCISKEEIQMSVLDDSHEDAASVATLKRIFNIYLLVQSELLRRLALCYCPDMWLPQTKKQLRSLSAFYRSLAQWTSGLYSKLDKAVKVYEAFGGTYERKAKLKGTPTVTGICSDIYLTMRSSSLHLQSVLARSRELEYFLEISNPQDKTENTDFLESVLVTIKDMQKDLRTSQVFLDDALVHVLKSKNALEGLPCGADAEKESEDEPTRDEAQAIKEVEPNPPVEDDVFEAVVERDMEESVKHEEDDMTLQEEKERREREKMKSRRVLSELKVVLKSKASEWKERERKVRQRKGCPVDGDDSDFVENSLEFLPTSSQSSWPLPRLKNSILNPRKKSIRRRSSVESNVEKSDEEKQDGGEPFIPGSAFSPGLLAEAMQKSVTFAKKREEDCFGDSGDETD